MNARAQIAGADRLPGKINYFVGNDPRKWQGRDPELPEGGVWQHHPGVDLVYYGNQRQLEYDFVVSPGADPRRITLEFDGAGLPTLGDSGDLVLRPEAGELRMRAPSHLSVPRRSPAGGPIIVVQQTGRVGASRGAITRSTSRGRSVIDPVLAYSTFLGGSGLDRGFQPSP